MQLFCLSTNHPASSIRELCASAIREVFKPGQKKSFPGAVEARCGTASVC